jgi:hypothetical protein
VPGVSSIGGIPPASRNHLGPKGWDTPHARAAVLSQ